MNSHRFNHSFRKKTINSNIGSYSMDRLITENTISTMPKKQFQCLSYYNIFHEIKRRLTYDVRIVMETTWGISHIKSKGFTIQICSSIHTSPDRKKCNIFVKKPCNMIFHFIRSYFTNFIWLHDFHFGLTVDLENTRVNLL